MAARLQHPAHLKAIIFDYGEVLCHRPTPAEIEELAGFFGISVDALPALWEKNRGSFDRGDLTAGAYWHMLAEDAGTKLSSDELQRICDLDMTMWSNVNSAMIDWTRQLGAAGLKLGLLSNMHPDMVAHCRKRFDWIGNFDFVTFSGEVRLIKPDPAIYQHTLRGLGVAPSEVLFLDDRDVNVQAARKLGIHAIRVQSMPQLRADLQTAGFTLLPANS